MSHNFCWCGANLVSGKCADEVSSSESELGEETKNLIKEISWRGYIELRKAEQTAAVYKTQKELKPLLPTDSQKRKKIPIGTGVLDYFPAALAEVAKVSWQGNEQHNPGEPLHWARSKSADHYDTMMRHALERGTRDVDGQRHSAKMVWRSLCILQLELEAEGIPMARGAKE